MVELGGVGWTGNQAGRDPGEDGPTRAEQSRAVVPPTAPGHVRLCRAEGFSLGRIRRLHWELSVVGTITLFCLLVSTVFY